MRSSKEQNDFLKYDRFGERKPRDPPRFPSKGLVIFIVVVILAATFHVYAVDEGAGGLLMWSRTEAYLFVQVSRRGYYASLLRFPWVLFKTFVIGGFAAVELTDDERASLVVIRVTDSGAERHVVKLNREEAGGRGGDPSKYTPLEGRIYAYCPWVIGTFMQDGHAAGNDMDHGLCWWAGDHFEKATDEERRRLDGIKRLTTTDFSGVWSRRVFVAGPAHSNFTAAVGDQFKSL
jgi:hypothetical protein